MKPNIDIPDRHAAKVAALLNQLLADEYVLVTKVRNYHWNVTGPNFNELHKFFETLYNELNVMIDDVAERARAVGFPTEATLAEFVKAARLQEHAGKYPTAQEMLLNLTHDYETMIRTLRKDVATSAELGDMGTSDFLTGLMEQHEKTAWMLRSLLN